MTAPLIHDGMRVPYVVRWSAEIDPTPFGWDGERMVYPDGRERRDLGVLWMREKEGMQGLGEPEFGSVSTVRQVECMQHWRCQVCGNSCEMPTPWLIPGSEAKLWRPRGGAFLTSTPPICPVCLPIARASCPDLKIFPPLLLTVSDYRPWGVFGEIVDERGHHHTEVSLGNHKLSHVLARQLVVEVTAFRKTREGASSASTH